MEYFLLENLWNFYPWSKENSKGDIEKKSIHPSPRGRGMGEGSVQFGGIFICIAPSLTLSLKGETRVVPLKSSIHQTFFENRISDSQ